MGPELAMMHREVLVMAVRALAYAVALACIVYIAACAREVPTAVYVGPGGECRYAATGSDAPDHLCGTMPRENHEARP